MKTIISLFALWCASLTGSAQQPAPSTNQPAPQGQCYVRRSPKRPTTTIKPAAPEPKSEPSPVTDFFVGAARVNVTKDETVVRLAMAQHGSVLIELPANDGPRYIIPGDPEMVTVDEKALDRNKRAIVVRPGSLFLPPPPNRKVRTPAATVTAQMRSGLVVTFLFYPVEDLTQNVHRCVLSYNRDEVVARRRAAGLPVNLDSTTQEKRNETRPSASPTTISVEANGDAEPVNRESSEKTGHLADSQKDPKPKSEPKDQRPSPPVTASAARIISEQTTNEPHERVKAITKDALAQAIKPPTQLRGWTKPTHGLALSVRQAEENGEFQIVIIAVRNTSAESLRLVSGTPDLFVEMLDDQERPINLESIRKLHTEVSETRDALPAGVTAYYAIAYVAPVLGVRQHLKVVVAQINAADEPASIALANRGL